MKRIRMIVEYLNDMVCIVEIMEHSGDTLSTPEWDERCRKYQDGKYGCLKCYADWLENDEEDL